MTPDHYDVIVVGARPAGAATALLLARAGLRVLIVDRSRYGQDTVSTHALMRAGVLQLHRWGVLPEIIAAGTPPVRETTFHVGDEVIPVRIKPGFGVDALYAPRRTVLDPIVADAATTAGARLRYGVSVTGISFDEGGRVSGIVGRTERCRRFEATARLVVGADGISSRLAQWVGARVDQAGSAAGAYVYGYWKNLPSDGFHWYFRRGAAAGTIPTNDGLTCVFIGTTRQRFRLDVLSDPAAGILAVTADASPELHDRLAGAAAVGPVRRFPGRSGFLRRAGGPGWALVGDAGYFKDPITAHGLSDALRDAELLARAITAVWDKGDEAAALAGYQLVRDRLSTDLLTVSDAIAAYTWDDLEINALLLRLSAAMADEVDYLAALPPFPGSPPAADRLSEFPPVLYRTPTA